MFRSYFSASHESSTIGHPPYGLLSSSPSGPSAWDRPSASSNSISIQAVNMFFKLVTDVDSEGSSEVTIAGNNNEDMMYSEYHKDRAKLTTYHY